MGEATVVSPVRGEQGVLPSRSWGGDARSVARKDEFTGRVSILTLLPLPER